MSTPDERTDAWLRRALDRAARPRPDAQLAARVLLRVAEREREHERQRRVGARIALGAYWLAAALASAWLLARLPFPGWAAPVGWAFVVALVPVGYVLALWPDQARECLRLWLRPLLPPPDGEQASSSSMAALADPKRR